jgi:hypothetical protein
MVYYTQFHPLVKGAIMLPFVDDRDAVGLNFVDDETFERAMGILHEGPAYGHPYELGFREGERIIIINRSDQHFFNGLAYTEEHVATPDEVSLEDLARMRAERMRGE